MKKIFSLIVFFTVYTYAQKPYMLIVMQGGCPSCESLKQMILSNKDLKNTIKNYTTLEVMSKKQAQNYGLFVDMVPAIYFFAKEKHQLLTDPLKGEPENPKEFSEYIIEVYEKYNN